MITCQKAIAVFVIFRYNLFNNEIKEIVKMIKKNNSGKNKKEEVRKEKSN